MVYEIAGSLAKQRQFLAIYLLVIDWTNFAAQTRRCASIKPALARQPLHADQLRIPRKRRSG
jgi:hypothetical protein